MIAINLSKLEELKADPKAIQQIIFCWKSRSTKNTCFSFLKKKKKIFWIFHKDP